MVGEFGNGVLETYQSFLSSLPPWGQNFVNLFLLTVAIVIYSVIIWKFYRFIAKKNLLSLNLGRYNQSKHRLFMKFFALILYVIEYLVILPFLIFLWFGVFTILLILLTENLSVQTLLLISTIIISAIRITSYYKEDLSKDIAKMLPFTLLGVFITNFTSGFSFERILSQLSQIPNFFSHIFSYLAFIFLVEFVLRIIEILFVASGKISEEDLEN